VIGASVYRYLAEQAWIWVMGQVRDDDGPWLPDAVREDDGVVVAPHDRDCLYCGIAGLAPLLAEIGLYRALTGAEQDLADRIVARLVDVAATRVEASLYDGLAGDATAVRLLAPGAESAVLHRLAALVTPVGWPTTWDLGEGSSSALNDVIGGTAGIVMAVLWASGPAGLIATGAHALLGAAEETPAGLDWRSHQGYGSSSPNFSHGTAGVASALALAGIALQRPDLVDAARRGAEHVVSVASLENGGLVVPHTIPPSTRDVEPVTYTWCHGPAGTSLMFAALARAGVPTVAGFPVTDLRRRCLHAILESGVPQRLRPGFWDNDGRCCGTAGVGDTLLDAAQDGFDQEPGPRWLDGAVIMGDALVERAIVDREGARWRFVEHRQDPPLLPPATSWMQGTAGIAAFLFRLARVLECGPGAPIVDRPDQWWAVPDQLRTVHVDGTVPTSA
jgi:Lanthionine synthetase C-like protein